jgi:hypothetical protein
LTGDEADREALPFNRPRPLVSTTTTDASARGLVAATRAKSSIRNAI